MKSASAELIAHLNSSQSIRTADLYTLTLAGGDIYRYTSADFDVTTGGHTFSSSGPVFERTRLSSKLGLEVTELELLVAAKVTDLIGSLPFLQAARMGFFDNAEVQVDRAVMESWGNMSLGTITHFVGSVATVDVSRIVARFTVRSATQLLNVMMPRNLYQASCRHTLYDSGCTVARASFKVSNAVIAAGSTATRIVNTLAQAANYFALGYMTFTSGPNAGVTRNIKAYTPGLIHLSFPLASLCGNGDTFDAYPGCDKLQATCENKFSNKVNYGGQPYIPMPDTMA